MELVSNMELLWVGKNSAETEENAEIAWGVCDGFVHNIQVRWTSDCANGWGDGDRFCEGERKRKGHVQKPTFKATVSLDLG